MYSDPTHQALPGSTPGVGHTSEGFDLLAGRIWRKAARTVALSVLVNLSDWFNNDQCAMVASGDYRESSGEIHDCLCQSLTGQQTTDRNRSIEGTRAGLPLNSRFSVKRLSVNNRSAVGSIPTRVLL